MSNRQKIGIGMALAVCLSIIILLSQFFLRESYTATPGNDRIAFVAASSPGLSGLFVNYDIYVMNINTFGLIRITRQVDIDTMPTWSPQGDKIAYYSTNGLYITDTDGSGQPELLWDGVAVDPAWSLTVQKLLLQTMNQFVFLI
jgi:Tol biopolymer transport system component